MNVLERLNCYLSELPQKKQQLYCRFVNDALYLPNSDEFFVKEVRNNNNVYLYLFSSKVKNRLVTIAKLKDKRSVYGYRSFSTLSPVGFKFENDSLYLYVCNSSKWTNTGGRVCIFRYNLSISSNTYNPELLGTFNDSGYYGLLKSQSLIRIVRN